MPEFGPPSAFGTTTPGGGLSFDGGSNSGQFSFGPPSAFSDPSDPVNDVVSPGFFSNTEPQIRTGGTDGGDFRFSEYAESALGSLARGAGRFIQNLGIGAGRAIANAPPVDLDDRMRRQSRDQLRNPTLDRRFTRASVDGRFDSIRSAENQPTGNGALIPGVSNGALLFGAVALVGAVMLARG